MSDLYQEYSATNANPRPCYSNLKCYGCQGRYRTIVPPTPVTVQPWIFNVFTPHKMPTNNLAPSVNHSRCLPYKNLDGTCRTCYK